MKFQNQKMAFNYLENAICERHLAFCWTRQYIGREGFEIVLTMLGNWEVSDCSQTCSLFLNNICLGVSHFTVQLFLASTCNNDKKQKNNKKLKIMVVGLLMSSFMYVYARELENLIIVQYQLRRNIYVKARGNINYFRNF